jgi:hypothetical protein
VVDFGGTARGGAQRTKIYHLASRQLRQPFAREGILPQARRDLQFRSDAAGIEAPEIYQSASQKIRMQYLPQRRYDHETA